MTDQGALEAANRAAHELARAAMWRQAWGRSYRYWDEKAFEDILGPEAPESRAERRYCKAYNKYLAAGLRYDRALYRYVEAERRAQREATGKGGVDGSS